MLNLAGYVIGTLVLSPIADTIGRRNMLLITMLITGAGSLYNALAPGYANFVIARVITGIGIGADLAIVNTYLGEVAPRRGRARYTAVILTLSAWARSWASGRPAADHRVRCTGRSACRSRWPDPRSRTAGAGCTASAR